MSASPAVHLGIDGGGTHSFGVAVSRDGTILAAAQSGSLNFLGADLPTARRSLASLLAGLRRQLPPGTVFQRPVIGCAALFADATRAEKRALCTGLLPLASARVISDLQTAHFGATLGEPGVVIVAGTGSMVLARGSKGAIGQAGGWGHVLGDEGSAWWIAREALRAALAAREGRGRQTLLNAAICRSLGVENLDAAVARFHAPGAKDEIAAAASRLPQYLPRADPVFSEILTRAGAELASQALAALRQSGLTARPVPVFLLGGVLAHNRRVRASLIKALQARLPISVKPPCLRPVLGAAALSLSASGISLTSGILRRLRNYREPHTAAN